jgi:ATP-dependent DNA helicase RecG
MKYAAPSTTETESVDYKSLRAVVGNKPELHALAQDCVCFANAGGGQIVIGIEDGRTLPPADQRVPPEVPERIRKRIAELTVNVQVLPEVRPAENGGEVVVLTIPRATGVASTSDGRYFLRIADDCLPIVGDDILRLANERPAMPWEAMTSLGVPRTAHDKAKARQLLSTVRASDRVKRSVREKNDSELLDHYRLAEGDKLTNLGVLLLGRPSDRAKLGTAPVVQAIKYDEQGTRIQKLSWDDYELSPIELLDAVWTMVPDFREAYELPDGMFRQSVPAFEEVVVREILVNALVHRPYTQRGDIFLNLHPDRLEVVNPGRLPLGVTPRNILHTSRRRNDGLARVFHDLQLMEREGSGVDLVYERLLASGRTPPVVREGTDSVHVVIERRVVHPGVIRLLAEVDQRYHLTQRERIAFGLLAQTEGLSAADLAGRLELDSPTAVHGWIDRLFQLRLIEKIGRTKATRYFVPPKLIKGTGLDGQTTLARIAPHRLRALILEDVARYPASSSSTIHERVAPEVPQRTVRRAIKNLVDSGKLTAEGERRWRTYRLAAMPNGHAHGDGRDDGSEEASNT